jgi:hypothetical protein
MKQAELRRAEMADELENHTICLLRELRDEMRVEFAIIWKQFEKVDRQVEKVDERFDDMGLRFDGLAHMLMLLAGRSHHHEERIEKLEGGKPVGG